MLYGYSPPCGADVDRRADVTFHHLLPVFRVSPCSSVHCFQTRITVELLHCRRAPIAGEENPPSRRPIILPRSSFSTIQMLFNSQVVIAFSKMKVSMQEKSVLEQQNVADTYDGPGYIIVDKNALCDIFKYTFCDSCKQSTLKLEFGHKYGFSHQLKLVCKTCSEQKMECFTSPRLEKKSNTSTAFDVNVCAFSSISCNRWGAMHRLKNLHVSQYAFDVE
ncbi:hypothetical protein TNCV_3211591 [Trichonephila clavipes]|uniref:Uncharacterized protein n=1 Tax=Trichonephila clavipes TaxID=2585209 RepID=A0A8X6S605_TRICX|nr:hypothetical protein TNCV_3211591 [Trichonephila clavipes]